MVLEDSVLEVHSSVTTSRLCVWNQVSKIIMLKQKPDFVSLYGNFFSLFCYRQKIFQVTL